MKWRVAQIALFVTVLLGGWFMSSPQAQYPGRGPAFMCNVVNSTTATLVAFAASATCPAANAAETKYITDIVATASAIATTSTDAQLQLKYGTGTNCGTGTTVIYNLFNLAMDGQSASFVTPIQVPAGNDLCWMDGVTGNKSFTVTGYIVGR